MTELSFYADGMRRKEFEWEYSRAMTGMASGWSLQEMRWLGDSSRMNWVLNGDLNL
jgi:hypothetical protein